MMAALALWMLSLLASTAAVAAQAAGAPGDEAIAAQTVEASGDEPIGAQVVLVPGDEAIAAPASEVAADDLETLAAAGRWETLRSQVEARLLLDASDVEALFWLGREQLEEAWGLLDGDRVARDIGRSVLDRAIESLGAAVRGAEPRAADWWLQARYSRWQLGSPGTANWPRTHWPRHSSCSGPNRLAPWLPLSVATWSWHKAATARCNGSSVPLAPLPNGPSSRSTGAGSWPRRETGQARWPHGRQRAEGQTGR